jgi:hypothetical protein
MGGKRLLGLAFKGSDIEVRFGSAVKVKKRARTGLTAETKRNWRLRRHRLAGCRWTTLAGCGKTRPEASAVPQSSVVSTNQPDKK